MKCEDVEILILKKETGNISENEMNDLNEHLLNCDKCSEYNVFSDKYRKSIKESIDRDFKLTDKFTDVVLKRTGKKSISRGIITLVIAVVFLITALSISDIMKKDVIQTPSTNSVTVENV